MINLWLDDMRYPGKAPHVYPLGSVQTKIEWKWAKTVREAKEIIMQAGGITNVDYMALDHDLGWCESCEKLAQNLEQEGKTFTEINKIMREVQIHENDRVSYSSCVHNGDGTEFVRWMRDNDIWPKRPPTVHSFNPDGAHRMQRMIDEHYRNYRSQ